MKTIDLSTIGTSYNIVDENGTYIDTIQILGYRDILTSALGEYSDVIYLDYNDYIRQSQECLKGFPESKYDVHWHTCYADDYELKDVVDYCMANNHRVAVVEFLEEINDTPPDTGFY